MLAEMENRRRKHRGRMAVADALDEMIERADTARGDNRHRNGICHRASERDIKAGTRAVAVHGGEQDLAGAKRDNFFRISDRIEPCGFAPALSEHLPAALLA